MTLRRVELRAVPRLSAWVVSSLVLLASACAPSAGGPTPAPPVAERVADTTVDFEFIRALVETRGARSIEELLRLLPPPFRSRYVLMFESRSVQGASYASPRVLLHTPDARFVLTFNGAPGQAGYDSLETMEYDDARSVLQFREVSFRDYGPHAVTISEVNPPRCLTCHGEEPRAIWDLYPTWPGAYGEREHRRLGPAEARGLATFIEHREDAPRYSALGGIDGFVESLAPGDARDAYEGKSALSRNAEFGLSLQILAYRMIVRELERAPGFGVYGYVLLAALDPQCLDVEDFVPAAVRARYSRPLDAAEAGALRANRDQVGAKRRRMHMLDEERDAGANGALEALGPFRHFVEEGLGIPTRDWTLALEKDTYDFSSPRRAVRVLERELFAAVTRVDPSLAALAHVSDRRDAYCAVLKKRSLAALGGRGR